MSVRDFHVGVDATSWSNDRGFGRFTREILSALAARRSGFRYTLLFDRLPDATLPSGVAVLDAGTQRTPQRVGGGKSSRSLGYLWSMGRLARKEAFDVFSFQRSIRTFRCWPKYRVSSVITMRPRSAFRNCFPTALNHRLWQAKTALARLQTTRDDRFGKVLLQISKAFCIFKGPYRRRDRGGRSLLPHHRRSVRRALRPARASDIPPHRALLVHLGGMNAHKNIPGPAQGDAGLSLLIRTCIAIVGGTSGEGFWDNVDELKRFVADHPPLADHVCFTGYVSDAALMELLNAAYALVFPSLWEDSACPRSRPWLAACPSWQPTRQPARVVGEAGLYFEPDDPTAVAACVVRLLRDPAQNTTPP